MSGVTIAYDVTDPADSKNLGLGAGDIRSYKTNMQGALAAEHLWPAAGGYSGVHLAGSARAFYGTNSQVSSADTDGRLMLTSDGSRLWTVGSTATHFLGGRAVPEVGYHIVDRNSGVTYTSLLTQAWAMETGSGMIPVGSSSTAITLQHTYVRATVTFSPFGNVTNGWWTNRPTINSSSTAMTFTGATLTVQSVNTNGDLAALASGQTLIFGYQVMGFRAL